MRQASRIIAIPNAVFRMKLMAAADAGACSVKDLGGAAGKTYARVTHYPDVNAFLDGIEEDSNRALAMSD